MPKVFITSPDVRRMQGVGKVSGKAYDMSFQTGHLFSVDDAGTISEFPEKFEFVLEKDQAPFQRGAYVLAESSPYVDREGHLAIRTRLIPVPAAASK